MGMREQHYISQCAEKWAHSVCLNNSLRLNPKQVTSTERMSPLVMLFTFATLFILLINSERHPLPCAEPYSQVDAKTGFLKFAVGNLGVEFCIFGLQ